ncbi:MAG: response regulator [Pirellulales bacterium]
MNRFTSTRRCGRRCPEPPLNAFKHTLKGFIEVTVKPVDDSVELLVRDSGVGIPEDELPRIFNRFHRVASTTGRTIEGSGIGLSMVLELVRLHGGTVTAASRLDEGSSFTVRIPCGRSHLPADQIATVRNRQTGNRMLESFVEEIRSWSTSGSSPTPAAAGISNDRESTVESDYFKPASELDASTDNKPFVLLVEDNADMRRYIHRLLQDEYLVHATSNGIDALTTLRRHKPELILTDVMMPHMDGFELLKHIRSEPDTQYIPVIMLSARAGEESRVEGMQAGADDYLVKPFSGRELQARVASHLQMAKLRRRTDESIRESEMRFRALTCAGTDVVYQMSADWSRMLFLQGREFISDTQSPSDSWLGKYILPEDQETVLAAIRHAIDHKCMFELEHRVLRSDGTVGWTHSRAVPILDNDGNILEWIGAAGDVTARKEAEVELRESERRERLRADELETMMRAVPACVWIAHDPDCRRITGNHEADRALRLPMHANPSLSAPDDQRPTHFRVLKAGRELSPHELPVQLAARGMEVRDFEEEIVFNDGARIHLFGHAMPLSDERGQVRGSVAAFVDISERKRIEEANAQLIDTLKNADQLKDEFLATLAHELRNPLAPIRTGLQVIKLVSHDQAAVAQAREMMERQLGQLVHLVDDLLDLSRISRGKIELRREAVDLADVIRQAVETCLPLVERAGHELNVTLPDEPIMVDADATRLTQIFSNLLNNAAKYTEPSGQIELSMTRHENEVSVGVRDNGLGIPEEMLPLVFEMFTQVDRNLERSQGGLGIGLSIVKRLVEMHGGRVTAESRGIGKGSTFTVSLPLLQTIDTASNITSAAPAVSKRRILIADDNRDAAYSLALMLRLMGNETRTAEDGVQALEAAAEFRPDLIVLDLGMPRMNGYETARRIRLQSWGKHVFLIALTGWGQEEDRRKSQEAGRFDAHIVKPIDPAVLEELLPVAKQKCGDLNPETTSTRISVRIDSCRRRMIANCAPGQTHG